MKRQDIETIKETISVLVGQPLRNLGRAGTSLVVANFGKLVEKNMMHLDENGEWMRDESGKISRRKGLQGNIEIHISCSVRMTCGDEILLSKSDIFLPNTKLAQTQKVEIDEMEFFDWDNFDPSAYGSNYFDEKVGKYVGDEPFEFAVKKVSVTKFGDLTIGFENGFALELFADGANDSENWCIHKIDDESFGLAVFGDGIEKNEQNTDD